MTAILSWLATWWPTILICLALIAFVALLIYSLIRDKKKGKSACCGGCSGCAMIGQCHRSAEVAPGTPQNTAPKKEDD